VEEPGFRPWCGTAGKTCCCDASRLRDGPGPKSSGEGDDCLRIEQDSDDGHDGEGKATDKEKVEALAGVGISVLDPVEGPCSVSRNSHGLGCENQSMLP
jgi:hypothetical protein